MGDVIGRQFQNVPKSMFTIFRCSFGDCSTDDGTPLFPSVWEEIESGWVWSVAYSAFTFIVTIGLFNIISAIFVESTLAAAANLHAAQQHERLQDKNRWAVNFVRLLKALINYTWVDEEDKKWLDEFNKTMDGTIKGYSTALYQRIFNSEFLRDHFDEVVKSDSDARSALDALDIDCGVEYLSDILDPDNSGTIGVLELIDGLRRLRGDPKKSDIISVILMLRSMQVRLDDVWGICLEDHPDKAAMKEKAQHQSHVKPMKSFSKRENCPSTPQPSP